MSVLKRPVARSVLRWRAMIVVALFVFILPVFVTPRFRGVSAAAAPRKHALVLISLDGFRWDYLDRNASPNIKAIASRGVRAKSLISVFPSETFPNHYSIVTGVYPEKHGIVKNNMYDPVFDASFSMGRNSAESRWWGAEPIWITAVKQGQLSGVYFWPGSEAEVEATRPTYWEKYDGKVPNSQRIDQVLAWLTMPDDKRPSFVAVYFSDTDSAGHEHGPDSPEVLEAIKTVDVSIGQLVDGLKAKGLIDQTDVVIVSDHGMAAASRKQAVYVGDYVDQSLLQKRQFGGTNGIIWPLPGKEAEVYQALLKAPHMKVYRKEETPAYFHYRDNRRIGPIVCVADEGWLMGLDRASARGADRAGAEDRTIGEHGYDPRLHTMQGIFVAAGPDIKEKLVVGPFENIQIYNLMCRILGLKPSPNDGNLEWTSTVSR
jgi:predicted AlkP superfamily pyrophosphatase or phosphodiesterase